MSEWTVIPLTVGILETNCYLLKDSDTGHALCIDPGGDAAEIAARVTDEGVAPLAILITHGHGDHIGATARLHQEWDVPVVIHADDAEMLLCSQKNLSASLGYDVRGPAASHIVHGNEALSFAPFTLTVLHTPGHTRGGVCYYCAPPDAAPILFSGDTLFCGDVGRCDLPGGSFDTLSRSIKEKLYVLPDSTRVYPGHGPSSTIGAEKITNAYVQA